MKLTVIHDEASGFWTGKPWLVIDQEDQPAVAAFKTDLEAFDFVDEEQTMTIPSIETIETKEQAHDLAVDWQDWQSRQSLSYGEIAVWQALFREVADKFGLTAEFKENGII